MIDICDDSGQHQDSHEKIEQGFSLSFETIVFLGKTEFCYYFIHFLRTAFALLDMMHLNICSYSAHIDDLHAMFDNSTTYPYVLVLIEILFSEQNTSVRDQVLAFTVSVVVPDKGTPFQRIL